MTDKEIDDKLIKLIIQWYGEQEIANRWQRKAKETWKTIIEFIEKYSMKEARVVSCWQKARPDINRETAEKYAWMSRRTSITPRIRKAVFEEDMSVRAAIRKFAVPQMNPKAEPLWVRLLTRAIRAAYDFGIPLVEVAKKAEEIYAKLAA